MIKLTETMRRLGGMKMIYDRTDGKIRSFNQDSSMYRHAGFEINPHHAWIETNQYPVYSVTGRYEGYMNQGTMKAPHR